MLRLLCAALALWCGTAGAEPQFRTALAIPGDAQDLMPAGAAGTRRLGGFFSDLYYNRATDTYLALPDRGPGGGNFPYDARLHRFTLRVDPATGAIADLRLAATVPLQSGGQAYTGLSPALFGDKSVQGRSLDAEGVVAGLGGRFYVADEYGPSVLEFGPDGVMLRSFAPPDELVPLTAEGVRNHVDGRPVLTHGRQDNRGYEGLAISPDGSRLFAIVQDPLVQDGVPTGWHSRTLRIVEYDVASGRAGRQWAYQLDTLGELNALGAGPAFSGTDQGRRIGVNAIVALNDTEFLVLERDNRGVGVDDPEGRTVPVSKRIYRVDTADATNVAGRTLAANGAVAGVAPVRKTLFLDVAEALRAAGQLIPEKMEGLAIGPQLADGSYVLLVGTDNDFSVTLGPDGQSADLCMGARGGAYVPLDTPCPDGTALLPTMLYSFQADIPGYVRPRGP